MPTPELTIDLIRHAESTMNVQMEDLTIVPFIGGRENHIELSSDGVVQARKLGYYALEHTIVPMRLFHSPATRSLRTQQLSSEVMDLHIEPVVDNRLQELDQGAWTGQPRTLYDEPANKRDMARLGSAFRPPGGESINDVADRMDDFMNALEPVADSEHIWVHSHGVSIKSWVGRKLGWSHEQTYKAPVHNASMTRVTRKNALWRVQFFDRLTS